jgi:chromate reductase
LEIFTPDEIPLFSADVMAEGDPPPVQDLKERIQAADALLIASPEYNYSIPGVLKNALDWASRPSKHSVLRGKPIGIMGASGGDSGTIRCGARFDAAGNLIDAELRQRLRAFVAALVDWARLVGSQG